MNEMIRIKIAGLVVCLFVVAITSFSSFYTINQGDRGVVLRFSKIVDTTQPGLHFKWPIIETVEKISVRTHKVEIQTDTYSKDIQAANVKLSVNYSLNPASVATIYTQYNTDFE
jgi:regulator of protease activity HflC (stomatin/prohibitin superfamily)